ncbi:MAG TPA: carbohydrate kinase [Terriglobales bacterium]|jgi:fructokinase|nr:carbohydrate kinase [Terriglobales bacterium]
MNGSVLMVGLGELLWDVLPTGKVLGGAPANFAYMSSILGNRGVPASRVGNDPLGKEARQQLHRLGLADEYVQLDPNLPTGTAGVLIDAKGQPTFTIHESVAWDFLQWTPAWQELSAHADIICFGSLAQRTPTSAETIDRFLRNSRPDAILIFDANLRQSYHDRATIKRSLEHADILKLSDQELPILASRLGVRDMSQEELAFSLIQEFQLRLVCITLADKGSVLLSESQCVTHPGFAVEVVDAVGAGDAFTACLAHCFIRGHSLEEIGAYANRLASWVATQQGATPPIQRAQVRSLLQSVGRAGGKG